MLQTTPDLNALKKVTKTLAPSAQDDVQYVRLHCEAITSLLMSPMSNEKVFDILVRGARPSPDKTTPLRERCEANLYRGPNGEIGLPQEVLFACLEAGSPNVKVGRKKLGTAKVSEVGSILKILEPFIAFPEDSQQWEADCRRGQGKTGDATGICRPRFDDWKFTFTLQVNLGQFPGLSLQHIVDLVDTAGRQKGVASFRKRYGRFGVVRAEVLELTNGAASH